MLGHTCTHPSLLKCPNPIIFAKQAKRCGSCKLHHFCSKECFQFEWMHGNHRAACESAISRRRGESEYKYRTSAFLKPCSWLVFFLVDGLQPLTTLEIKFIQFMMEEEFNKAPFQKLQEIADLDKICLPTGPHYPFVVKIDFRVTPHFLYTSPGERFLNSRSLVTETQSDAQIDELTKGRLRAMKNSTGVFCYGIAPFGADGWPIVIIYNKPHSKS